MKLLNFLINRVVTFMRVTYPNIFEIRLKSIEFNEKHMNLKILIIFYSHIIRIFHYFFIRILFAYFTSLFVAFHFVAKLRVKNVIFYLIYI